MDVMGQAKIRKTREMSREEILSKVDIERLALAIQRVCTAASAPHGADCYLHAWLAKRFLEDRGVHAFIEVGNAAWRVGPGDGDVLSHVTPEEHIDQVVAELGELPGQRGAFMYHAWVRVGEQWIFDATTYLIPSKAEALDAADGSTTAVNWKPDFLLEKATSGRSFSALVAAYDTCFHYRKDERMQSLIERGFEGSEDDYSLLCLAYNNPQAIVIGPNHVRPKMG